MFILDENIYITIDNIGMSKKMFLSKSYFEDINRFI